MFPKNKLELKKYCRDHKKNDNSLILKEFRNYGYGSECLQLIKKYAFNYLNLRSLWASVFSNNKTSIKSNIKSGGKICGELKKHTYRNGKYYYETLIQYIK